MKALTAKSYGQPSQLVLVDTEQPKAAEGQILIEVRATSANPFDVKLISGYLHELLPLQFPYVVGMDVAGVVTEVGAGVSRFKVGEKVFGILRETAGACAEYAVAKADGPMLTSVPEGLDLRTAAALPEVGLTALTLLRAAQLQSGQTVLIIGATGGIGMVLTQLVTAMGAHVIATAGPQDADYVRSLGAKETIDYTTSDTIEEVLKQYPEGVDVVFDVITMGDAIKHVAEAVKHGGRLISSLQGPDPKEFGRDDITASYIFLSAQPGDLDELAAKVLDGKLRVEISETYPLEQAAQAFIDLANTHTRGKRIVTIP